MPTLDEQRQHAALAWLASGRELCIGDASRLPCPPAALAALTPSSPGVCRHVAGGLTGDVYELRLGGQHLAVKVARAESRVRNVDGETAFLNELLRHQELAAARDAGVALPGILHACYGSLQHRLLVTPWVDGGTPDLSCDRVLGQLFDTGVHLHLAGHFEWDWSPGNLLDDGQQVWLFDFGYQYRFDPLTQLNSAGDGLNCPQHHLVERLGARCVFAALLDTETTRGLAAAVAEFTQFQSLGLAAMRRLQTQLAQRGAQANVLQRLQDRRSRAGAALASGPATAYRCEGWAAHLADVHDDLHGQSCGPRTLQRLGWLQQVLHSHAAALQAAGLLNQPPSAMQAQLLQYKTQATQWQLAPGNPAG